MTFHNVDASDFLMHHERPGKNDGALTTPRSPLEAAPAARAIRRLPILAGALIFAALLAVPCHGQPTDSESEGLPSPVPPAEWSKPVRPFRIAGNIYYVGTQGLSAFLIGSPQEAVLLDGTLAVNADLIERNIHAVGVPLSAVKILICDHAHDDHVGALAKIKADTGALVVASEGDRWALEHGRRRGQNIYQVTTWPPVKVDRLIHDGETIRVGETELTAHLTPGHTPGSTSWSTTVREGGRSLQVLFLCSITVAGNVLQGNSVYPAIAADYRETFRRLRSMRADILLTSHPDIVHIIERQSRREKGDADAFIDPTALPALVARSSEAFEKSFQAETPVQKK